MPETADANWLREVTEVQLLAAFGPNAVSLGRQYAAMGRVGRIASGGGEAAGVLQATVRGSNRRTYQTVVRAGRGRSIGSFCSCPVRTNCKHGVAVLLAFNHAELQSAPPQWQQVLTQVTEQERRASSAGAPLALQFSRLPGEEVQLRLLVTGKRGGWVRTGIDWDAVSRTWDSGFAEPQRRALAALRRAHRGPVGYGYYSHPSTLSLTEFGPDVWRLLVEAETAGVTLLGADPLASVRTLAEPARMIAALRTGDGGGLELASTLVADGLQWQVGAGSLIGEPAHGVALVADDELVLGPLVAPLEPAARTLLVRHRLLEIPAADAAVFAAGFLPSLRRMLDLEVDPDLELPELAPPGLLLRVGFGQQHATSLRWRFRYRVGERILDLEPSVRASDPPVRNPAAEEALVAGLPDESWAVWTDHLGRRQLSIETYLQGADSAVFVTDWLPRLQAQADIEVELSDDPPSYRRASGAPQISVGVTEQAGGTDWFDLAVTVSVDGEPVEFRELFGALARGDDHLILDSGTWFSLDRPELDQLRKIIAEARLLAPDGGSGLRLRPEHAGLWEELVSLGVVAEQSRSWRQAVGALLNTEELPAVGVPDGIEATLRGYQALGYRWLDYLWRARLGGILADDMGLGKTLQVLAVVAAAAERGELIEPVLVVAPTSVVGTWASEAAKFAPGLRVRTVDATASRRAHSLAELRSGADLVVTSYTLLRLEAEDYAVDGWSAVVLDEAQFVKNRATRIYKAVRRLSAGVKFAVTGTPLENNLMELWSLLSITAPGLFPDPERFAELYRRPIESGTDPGALARLRQRVRPLMLRRTKEAVATELPPKQEQLLEVTLAPAHRRTYDRHLAAERKRVLGLVDDLDRNRVAILRSLTVLRQLSLSAALVEPGAPATSAKIDTLIELVAELAAEGHRALVFSQFTSFLKLVRDRLDEERITYSYLDGRTRDREARIADFRSGVQPVFLISLKAGGFGLTLTEADYVFILDPWWNPAAETQAIDRTHRIGQDKPVNVYRLVSANTIEEKVVALQRRKRDLFDSVMGHGSDLAAPLSADDIRGLLELD